MGGAGNISRFERKDMPIKIHVTNGKMLPEGHGQAMTIQNTAVRDELSKMCTNPQFFARLQTDPAYQSNMGSSVMQGINRWQFLAQENVLSFVYENDPTKADIVVFWLPAFDHSDVGPKAYTSFLNSRNPAQKRVYMQFCTGGGIPKEIWNQWTVFSAAHEFGHAIGLNTHSPDNKDIMTDRLLWSQGPNGYVMPGFNISENDKLTVRALYDVTPDIAR
jgi:Matrixin.